jgi:hypothetical protein
MGIRFMGPYFMSSAPVHKEGPETACPAPLHACRSSERIVGVNRPHGQASALRFDANAIIDGGTNTLLAGQIPLAGLNGNVHEKN